MALGNGWGQGLGLGLLGLWRGPWALARGAQLGIAGQTVPRIGRLEAITPRQLLAMATANATEHFCRDQLGGVATPAAGQPQPQLDPSKAWAAAPTVW